MPANAGLATWGLGSGLGSGARGAREQGSARYVEDEEAMAMAMAARGGGAARSQRGEPTGAGEEEKNTGERGRGE